MVADAIERYLDELVRQPLAGRTRETYAANASAYAEWLARRDDRAAALREPRARDFAARDFKRTTSPTSSMRRTSSGSPPISTF